MVNAQYTVVLKTLLDAGVDLGMKSYPIWDEDYRSILNRKILDHFLLREIGFETPGLFKFYLNRTLDEIMPYYNQLYKTTIYEYNPIHNVDYTEEYELKTDKSSNTSNTTNVEGSVDGSTTGTSTGKTEGSIHNESQSSTNTTDNGKNVHIDTPQGKNVIGDMDVDNALYASDVKLNRNNATSSGSASDDQSSTVNVTDTSTSTINNSTTTVTDSAGESSGNETEKYLRRLFGNYGVKTSQAMIAEERELIINIDMKIIGELDSLFMQLW